MDREWLLESVGLTESEATILLTAFSSRPSKLFTCSEMELRSAGLGRVGVRKRLLRTRHMLAMRPQLSPPPPRRHLVHPCVSTTPVPHPPPTPHTRCSSTTSSMFSSSIRDACSSPMDVLLNVRAAEAFVRRCATPGL